MRDQVVIDDVLARRFLLGELPPEEQARIQERAFEDPETFEFLESIENDLIDEFIHGDLSEDEASRFENHFLTVPGRRSNLKVSQLWQEHFRRVPPVPRSNWKAFFLWFRMQHGWVKISIGLAGLLVLFGVVVLIVVVFLAAKQPLPGQAGHDKPAASPTPELKISPSQEPVSSPPHAENKPKSLTPQRQKRILAYAVLSPSSSPRSEDGLTTLKLPHSSPSMSLELPLITTGGFKSFDASLQDAKQHELKRWPNLQVGLGQNGDALKIDVPVSLLEAGKTYQIVVIGASTTNIIVRYHFEVAN